MTKKDKNDKQRKEERAKAQWQNRPTAMTPQQYLARAETTAAEYDRDPATNPPKSAVDVRQLLNQYEQLVLAGEYKQAWEALHRTVIIYQEHGIRVTIGGHFSYDAGDECSLITALFDWQEYNRLVRLLRPLTTVAALTALEPEAAAEALTSLGDAYSYLSQFSNAIRVYNQAVPIFEQLGDNDRQGDVLSYLVRNYAQDERLDDAIATELKFLEVMSRGDEVKRGYVTGLGLLNTLYKQRGQPSNALGVRRQLEGLVGREMVFEAKFWLHDRLATIYRDDDEPEKAAVHLEEVVKLADEADNYDRQLETFDHLVELNDQNGQPDKAIPYLQAAIALADRNNKYEDGISRRLLLTMHHLMLGEAEAAIAVARERQQLAEAQGNRLDEGRAYMDIGTISSFVGQHEQGIVNHQRALAIIEAEGDAELTAAMHYHLALSYKNAGRYAEAVEHYQRSLSQHQQLGGAQYQFRSLFSLAQTYEAMGDEAQASNYRHRASEIEQPGWAAEFAPPLPADWEPDDFFKPDEPGNRYHLN